MGFLLRFQVLTLFPEMIGEAVNTSIMGRAVKNGLISVQTVNIRDFSVNRTNRVDDYPYGGGAGMVLEAEPVFRAVEHAKQQFPPGTRVIYLTPQAKVLDQTMVEELAAEQELIILCGHYEGIDERVLEEVVTDYISIGDYVLTGGELGALVLMDAVSRFVPGVLSNEESSRFESMQDDLLEYPHYTRPEIWHGKRVPDILLCGDHKKVEEWRHQQSLARTKERRPDLFRRSVRVVTVFFGDESRLVQAEEINGAVSQYGKFINLNRTRQRKIRREFGTNDLVLIADAAGDGEDQSVILDSFLYNMFAQDSLCVFITFGEPNICTEKTKEYLQEKGFDVLGAFDAETDSPANISVSIRKKRYEKEIGREQ